MYADYSAQSMCSTNAGQYHPTKFLESGGLIFDKHVSYGTVTLKDKSYKTVPLGKKVPTKKLLNLLLNPAFTPNHSELFRLPSEVCGLRQDLGSLC